MQLSSASIPYHVHPPHPDTQSELCAIRERLDTLVEQTEQDEPQDYDVAISDTKQVALKLLGRRHLFVLAMATLTIVVQGWATPIQLTTAAGQWLNITFPEGTVIQTTGQASAVSVHFRATNEIVP